MPENNNYGGDTPRITNLSVDRLGILTMTVNQRKTYEGATIGSVLNANATIRAAPIIPGISVPCVGVNTPTFQDGGIIFSYGYEGFLGDVATSQVIYELEGADNQEPIETHPNFLDLLKKFGGVNDIDGRFSHFQQVAPKGIDGPKGLDGRIRNPMSGVSDYLNIGWTWRKSWLSGPGPIPASVYLNAGYIDMPIGQGSQQPPILPNSRNWLKLAPRCRWRGNCREIVEAWLASGRNGWIRAMYTKPAQ